MLYFDVAYYVCVHVTVPIPLNVTWMVIKGWLVWSGLLYQCVLINVCVRVTVPIPLNVTWMAIKGWLVWSGLLYQCVLINNGRPTVSSAQDTHHNRKRLCVCIDIIYTGYPHHRDNIRNIYAHTS